MTTEVDAGSSNANHVYVISDQFSWMPARVVEYSKTDPNQVLVSIAAYKDEDSIQSGSSSSKGQGMAGARAQTTTITIDLSYYPNRSLPLQNVNEDGLLQQVEDMVDLPFLHEVSRPAMNGVPVNSRATQELQLIRRHRRVLCDLELLAVVST